MGSSSSFSDVMRCITGEFKVPVIEGRGLFRTEAEAAEFLREFADNVAIRPRARMALPVFYFSNIQKTHKNSKKKRNKKHALEALARISKNSKSKKRKF